MADTEIRRVINIDTTGAGKSLVQLRSELEASKEALKDTEKGTQAYEDALVATKVAQDAYSRAVRLTVNDNKAAKGSYNELTAQMSRLKEQWRATSNEAERARLGAQIKAINDQLKDLDATTGNFQRNVGDYRNALSDTFKGLAEKTDALGKSLNIAKGGVNGFKDSFEAFGKSPTIATIGILVSLVVKLAGELKENETAMASLKKGMEALKPVTQFISGIVEKLAELLGDVIGKVSAFVTGNGLFQKIIQGVTGVGNAIMQFVVAPFKGIAAAVKVFKEQGVKGLGDAARAFGQEMKSGVAFKSNFQAGQVMAQTIAAGVKSKKAEIAGAAVEVVEEVQTKLMEVTDAMLNATDRKTQEAIDRMKAQAELDKEVMADLAEQEKEIEATMAAYYAEQAERQREAEEADLRRRQTMTESAAAIEAVLGSVASAYNTELQAQVKAGQISEREARKRFAFVKAFQLAQAILNTASGVMSVFSAPDNITMTQKWLQAAAVGARGAASIATINRSDIGAGAAAAEATQITALANAGQTAPQVQTIVPITRVGTNAEDEEKLNQMQKAQRVYVVYSDIAQAGNKVAVQTSESSW